MNPIRIDTTTRVKGIRTRVLALMVAGALVALSLGAGVASADGGHSPKDFHLTKTCVSNFLCTVQTDSFKWIPGGTDITYTYNGDGSDGLAYPTIKIRNGSTTGVCDWNHPVGKVLAVCTFGTGTGRLTQFHLRVDVSADDPNDPNSIWYWDGTYWFGGGH